MLSSDEPANFHSPLKLEPFVLSWMKDDQLNATTNKPLRTTISDDLESLTWKQSAIPGISLMTVNRQVRSIMPTRSNLGILELNYGRPAQSATHKLV